MLTLTSNEPITIELADGASVTLAAPTPRIVAAGRRAVREAMDADADLPADLAALVFSEGILAEAITDWAGIGDAGGKALELAPATVMQVLADTYIFSKLDAGYVAPLSMREMEKNGSAASSAGTSAGATAGKTTAGSAAASRRGERKRKTTSTKTAAKKR